MPRPHADRRVYHPSRGITINSKSELTWPWLVQLGYGRAGLYRYDVLENLGSARGIYSAQRTIPELQRIAVGDRLPLSVAGGLVFNAIEPNRYLVWSGKIGAYPGGFTRAL